MVQHGDLRQSREADCPPTSVEDVALSMFWCSGMVHMTRYLKYRVIAPCSKLNSAAAAITTIVNQTIQCVRGRNGRFIGAQRLDLTGFF
jgi:hypothetical protein